ncbi:MAG: LytTR family DNA-binding domain-containing protein [Bacteroidota bacterium]
MIRAIIIDDEKASREILVTYITKYCKNIKIDGTAVGVVDGKDMIEKLRPDLIFLDIEMRDGTGFDMLNQITTIDFQIIFISATKQYAERAFKYSASEYILKPINIIHLITAVEKVKEAISLKMESQNIRLLIDIVNNQKNEIEKIVINNMKGFKILTLKDIVMIKGSGTYTDFYLSDSNVVDSYKNLGFYSYLLEDGKFIQVHKSYYINSSHIKEFLSTEQTVQLTGDLIVPLGETYRKEFAQRFLL